MYLGKCDPAAASGAAGVDVSAQRELLLARARHVQVAGQQVVERRDVGRALDRRVAAQREDAAARPADVAEQQLQDRAGADHLHAGRVLRPADRVADGRRAVAARVADQRLGDLQELLAWACRRSARPSRACSASNASAGSGRRSAGAAASRRAGRPRPSCPPRSSRSNACVACSRLAGRGRDLAALVRASVVGS